MARPPYVYEIEFDVLGRRRDEYEVWLESTALGWISHEAVAGFERYRNDQGLSPTTKLVFEFESLQEWAAFVGSDEHSETTERLETVTDRLNATLWHRAGLQVSWPSERTRRREKPPHEHQQEGPTDGSTPSERSH